MRQESQDKQELIINAAIRRFSHFGVGKTTMTEIADDVKLSKQSLGYYFPEKQSLIDAVEGKIIEEYFDRLEAAIKQAASGAKALEKIVDVKEQLIERYYMMAIEDGAREAFKAEVSKNKIRERVTNRLVEKIAKVIEVGVQSGEFRVSQPQATAKLMYEIMESHQHCALTRTALPDMKQVHATMKKQKEILRLLINGLRHGDEPIHSK